LREKTKVTKITVEGVTLIPQEEIMKITVIYGRQGAFFARYAKVADLITE